MRRIHILWLVSALVILSTNHLQAQNCLRPVINALFADAQSKLEATKFNQDQAVRHYVSHNCLSSFQIRELSKLYTQADDRYAFVVYAYDFVYNEEKYSSLVDVFAYRDEQKRFDKFLNERRRIAAESTIDPSYTTSPKLALEKESTEDVYVENYKGPLGCLVPMDDAEYLNLKKAIGSKTFDDAKMKTAKKMLKESCLKSEQVISIARTFELEKNRLKLAKMAWPQTYDLGNFFKVSNLFEFEMTSDNLRGFMEKNPLKSQGTIMGSYPGKIETENPFERTVSNEKLIENCESPMTQNDFDDAKRSIRKQIFSDTRMKMAKQIVRGNCMSTNQIKETMLILEEEKDRLNFAKYAFDFAWDQRNYSQVNAALSESGSINELSDYLESKDFKH